MTKKQCIICATQKAVTTEGTNVLGEKAQIRLCSEPTKVAEDIHDKLGYKKMPFSPPTL